MGNECTKDAEIIIKPIAKGGFQVTLKTISDVGPFNSPGPYVHTGWLRRGRPFNTVHEAMGYCNKYWNHNYKNYRTMRIVNRA